MNLLGSFANNRSFKIDEFLLARLEKILEFLIHLFCRWHRKELEGEWNGVMKMMGGGR